MNAGRDAAWCSIVLQQKPSKAISQDTSRQSICQGHIRHEGDGTYLYCTDSYILARIPVKMECESKERPRILPEMGIGRQALEALDEGSRFRFSDGSLEIEGHPARWPVSIAATSPNFADLMKYRAEAARERKEAEAQERLVFSPDNFQRLSEALGFGQPTGIAAVLEPTHPHKAITVRPFLGDLGIGLLMPIRSSD